MGRQCRGVWRAGTYAAEFLYHAFPDTLLAWVLQGCGCPADGWQVLAVGLSLLFCFCLKKQLIQCTLWLKQQPSSKSAPVLYGVQRLGPSAGQMDQGRVVSWSLPAQPRSGLNADFGELLKFRPGSELPNAWIRDVVCDATQTFS